MSKIDTSRHKHVFTADFSKKFNFRKIYIKVRRIESDQVNHKGLKMHKYSASEALQVILDHFGGDKVLASKKLQISLATLYNWLSGKSPVSPKKLHHLNVFIRRMNEQEVRPDIRAIEETVAIESAPSRHKYDSDLEEFVVMKMEKSYGVEKEIISSSEIHLNVKLNFRPDILVLNREDKTLYEIVEVKNGLVDISLIGQILAYAEMASRHFGNKGSLVKLSIVSRGFTDSAIAASEFLQSAGIEIRLLKMDEMVDLKF